MTETQRKLRNNAKLLIKLLNNSQNLQIVKLHTSQTQLITNLMKASEIHDCRYDIKLTLLEKMNEEMLTSIAKSCFQTKKFSLSFIDCLWLLLFNRPHYGRNFNTRREVMTRIYHLETKSLNHIQSVFKAQEFRNHINRR